MKGIFFFVCLFFFLTIRVDCRGVIFRSLPVCSLFDSLFLYVRIKVCYLFFQEEIEACVLHRMLIFLCHMTYHDRHVTRFQYANWAKFSLGEIRPEAGNFDQLHLKLNKTYFTALKHKRFLKE